MTAGRPRSGAAVDPSATGCQRQWQRGPGREPGLTATLDPSLEGRPSEARRIQCGRRVSRSPALASISEESGTGAATPPTRRTAVWARMKGRPWPPTITTRCPGQSPPAARAAANDSVAIRNSVWVHSWSIDRMARRSRPVWAPCQKACARGEGISWTIMDKAVRWRGLRRGVRLRRNQPPRLPPGTDWSGQDRSKLRTVGRERRRIQPRSPLLPCRHFPVTRTPALPLPIMRGYALLVPIRSCPP